MRTFEGCAMFTVFIAQVFANIERMGHSIRLSNFQLLAADVHVSEKQAELFGPLSDMLELGLLWSLEGWIQELLDCL